MFEGDALGKSGWDRHRRRRIFYFVVDIEELEKVGDEHVVLVQGGDIGQQILEVADAPLEGLVVHDHVADGYGPVYRPEGDQQQAGRENGSGKGLGEKFGKGPVPAEGEFFVAEQRSQGVV